MHEEKINKNLNQGLGMEEVKKILDEFKDSQLSQNEFCKRKGLSSHFFRKYRGLRQVKQKEAKKRSQRLIQLPFLKEVAPKGCEIVLNTERLSIKLSGDVPQALLMGLIREVTK